MKCLEQVREFTVSYVTIEPVLFLFALGRGLGTPTIYALWYRKVCMHEYSTEVCDNLHNETLYKEEEEWVQKTTSQWRFYENLVYVIPAMVFSIVYGSWGDRISRKVPIILPFVGTLLEHFGYILNSIFIAGSPALLLPSSFVTGVFGGYLTVLAASFGYLSEVTSLESRTARISIAYSVNMFSTSMATFVSGLMLENTGFLFMFSMTSFCFALGLVYIIFCMKDFTPTETKSTVETTPTPEIHTGSERVVTDQSQPTQDQGNQSEQRSDSTNQSTVVIQPGNQSMQSTDDQSQQASNYVHENTSDVAPNNTTTSLPNSTSEKAGCYTKFRKLFNLGHMKDAVLVLVKKRPPHQRVHVIILMFMVFYYLAVSGE